MIKLRIASNMVFTTHLEIFVSSWRRKLQKGGPAGFHLIVNLFASAARESVRDMQNNRDTTSSYRDWTFNRRETHWNIYRQYSNVSFNLFQKLSNACFPGVASRIDKDFYFYICKQVVEELSCKWYITQNQLFVDVTLNFACLLITSQCCHSVCTRNMLITSKVCNPNDLSLCD